MCTVLVSNENVKEIQTSHRPRDILLPDSSAARTEVLSGRKERKLKETEHSKDAGFIQARCRGGIQTETDTTMCKKCLQNESRNQE